MLRVCGRKEGSVYGTRKGCLEGGTLGPHAISGGVRIFSSERRGAPSCPHEYPGTGRLVPEEFGQERAALGFGGRGFTGRGSGSQEMRIKHGTFVCRTSSVCDFCTLFHLLAGLGNMTLGVQGAWWGGSSEEEGCQPRVHGGTGLKAEREGSRRVERRQRRPTSPRGQHCGSSRRDAPGWLPPECTGHREPTCMGTRWHSLGPRPGWAWGEGQGQPACSGEAEVAPGVIPAVLLSEDI